MKIARLYRHLDVKISHSVSTYFQIKYCIIIDVICCHASSLVRKESKQKYATFVVILIIKIFTSKGENKRLFGEPTSHTERRRPECNHNIQRGSIVK